MSEDSDSPKRRKLTGDTKEEEKEEEKVEVVLDKRTFLALEKIRGITGEEGGVNSIITNLLRFEDYRKYLSLLNSVKFEDTLRKKIGERLPFHIRLKIISYIPKTEQKYFVRKRVPGRAGGERIVDLEVTAIEQQQARFNNTQDVDMMLVQRVRNSLAATPIDRDEDNVVFVGERERGEKSGFPLIKSFQKGGDVTPMEYIRELFGYFREDRSRKVFLIFCRIAVKFSVINERSLRLFPHRGVLKSIRFYATNLSNIVEKTEDIHTIPLWFPKCLYNYGEVGLENLILTNVRIRDDKALILLVSMLRTFKHLRRFKLSNCDFNGNGFSKEENVLLNDMMVHLSKMHSISIISTTGLRVKYYEILTHSSTIMKLAIARNGITSMNFDVKNTSLNYVFLQNNFNLQPMISDNEYINLRVINVSKTALNLVGLKSLLLHKRLRKIVACQCIIADEPRCDLGTEFVSNLEFLNLNKSQISPKLCTLVSFCQNLSQIVISRLTFRDRDLAMMKLSRMKNLQKLLIGWNANLSEKSFADVLKITSVEKLVIPQLFLSDKMIESIFRATHVKQLSIRSKNSELITKQTLDALKFNNNLEYLNITKQVITSEHVLYIKHSCQNLKVFKFSQGDNDHIWYSERGRKTLAMDS